MKFINLFIILLFLTNVAMAKNINLYSEPQNDAKPVGTINSETGIIPIYSPKGDWIKVADPTNGNVGWIKSNELATAAGTSSFTFTQKTIGNDKQPQSYQMIQFGNPKLSPEQAKQLEMQQQIIKKNMEQMMQNMFKADTFNFPVMVPVMMVPQGAVDKVGKPMPNTTSPATKQ